MGLLELPHELIIQVAKFLEYDEDINSLSRTTRLLHMVLNDFLYQNHILNHGSSGLEWAASTGNESAARKLLDAGASPTVIGESTFKPIALAAKFGHAGLVKMFLDWKEKSSESEEEQEQEFERLRGRRPFLIEGTVRTGDRTDPMSMAIYHGRETDFDVLVAYGETEQWDIAQAGEAMWQSVKGGHLALVKRLAKMFPESVNTSENSSGNTPLSESLIYTVWDGIAEEITEDRIEMVRLLIESGADLNPMIPEGEFSPLSKAAMNGSVSLFEFFIQKGARVSTTESALRPLEEAASTGQAKLTDFLLDQLDVETALLGNRHDLAIILLAAATRGNEAIVQRILEKSRYQVAKLHPLKVHLLCSPGPLTSAARWGHVGTMKLLLKHGAYPNREPEETNPLFAACIGGHIQAVQVLISHGVDLSIKGDDGRSPLIPAIKFPPLFELLLDAGMPGESNCIDSFNVYRSGEIETPMGAAVKSGNVALVEKMKSLKVNWNLTKPPRPWITVLKQAAGGGVQMLKLVHRYGFVANPGEDEAEVAFQIAIGEGDLKAIAFFLERGFDPNPKDNPTRTFSHLELAVIAEVSKEKKGTIDLLLRHGAGVHNLRGFSYPFCKPSGGLQPEEAYLRFYRILLELGANPLPETQFGSFSWAMAAERNQKKVSRLFLQYIEKRNISIADLQHNMALIEAMPVVMDNRHIMKSWKNFYWRKVYPVPS